MIPSQKALSICIIGAANSGKSTIFNQILKIWASAVSHTYNTTRKNLIGCISEGNDQLVFVDTPGITNPTTLKKHKISTRILSQPNEATENCDLILCVVDASLKKHSLYFHDGVLNLLNRYPEKPSILVLNKSDLLKHDSWVANKIYSLTGGIINNRKVIWERRKFISRLRRNIQKECLNTPKSDEKCFKKFRHVFVTSALNNEGIPELTDYLLKTTEDKEWFYNDKNMRIKATPEYLAEQCTIENLLEHFPPNMVYQCAIKSNIAEEERSGILFIEVSIFVKHHYRTKFIESQRQQILTEISKKFNQQMSQTLNTQVSVKIAFKDMELMKEVG